MSSRWCWISARTTSRHGVVFFVSLLVAAFAGGARFLVEVVGPRLVHRFEPIEVLFVVGGVLDDQFLARVGGIDLRLDGHGGGVLTAGLLVAVGFAQLQ